MSSEITYTVRQGDYLAKIARAYGFADWKTIYDHPKNAAFKKKRPNPNVIYPGDELIIPAKDFKEVNIQVNAKTRVKIKTKQNKIILKLQLKDFQDQPVANKKYKLVFPESVIDGTTDGNGKMEATLDPEIEEGEFEVWDPAPDARCIYRASFLLGWLDPVEEASGIHQRLSCLGYSPGNSYNLKDPKFLLAVKLFQRAQGLTVDGVAGPKTQSKLKAVYGC